jgi:DNA primase catalytic core
VESLKRQVPLAVVLAHYGIEVVTSGKDALARCPFHEDANPSLVVSDQENPPLWKCFPCNVGGDALTFIQLKEKVGFKDALARLRLMAGEAPKLAAVPAEAPPPAQELPEMPVGGRRHELLTTCMTHYQKRFADLPDARAYLEQRGLGDPELWQTFGLGYVDGSLLYTLPRESGVRDELMALGILNKYGREHFKGCVVVPIHHPDFGLVALYGRRIDPGATHRHLFLRGTQHGVFNWQALTRGGPLYVTEGILDALSVWVAGVPDVTCIFSAANGLPQDLNTLLDRHPVDQVRLCLDGDVAGQQAAVAIARQLEARGMQVHRIVLPDKDANQLLLSAGPDALREALAQVDTTDAATTAPDDAPRPEVSRDGFILELDAVRYLVKPLPPSQSRLRVLLRATCGNLQCPAETVDLYSGRARTMMVNTLHRRLGLERELLEEHLLKLLEATEACLATPQPSSPQAPAANPFRGAPVVLTDQRREAAVRFLARPDLVAAILADMSALGYVGEDDVKLLVYLIAVSRKQKKPLSGVVLSQSGSGKSSLVELVEILCPPEDVCYYTRISATAPTYVPKDTFKHCLLILEERAGSGQADYHIRALQSRALLRQIVTTKDPLTGQMTVQANEVEGPIAYLETTTHPEIDEENATRCFELILDESEAQTARIHQQQRFSSTPEGLEQDALRQGICQRHHDAQRALESLPVAIPYAALLTFPTRWTRTRRDQARFLNLIRVSAFLHQHQRPRGVLPSTGEVYIAATVDDYRLAWRLARTVLAGTLHDLPQSCQDLWTAAHRMLAARTQGKSVYKEPFTRRELRQATNWPDRRLRENLDKLVELEYVAAVTGSQGKTYQYCLLPGGEGGGPLAGLLMPDELEARLRTGAPPAETDSDSL